jgi:hypothetical protein
MLRIRIFACFIAASILAACGGGGSSNAGGAPATLPAQKSVTTAGSIVLFVPNQSASAAASSATISSETRKALFVSPSSSSLGVSINGATATYTDVSTTSTVCAAASGGRTCTIPLTAPVGSDTLALSLYDGAAGAGKLLATGSGTTTTTVGASFSVTVTLSPVVSSATSAVFTFSSGSTFSAGTAATATVAFTLLDPDGNTITAAATPSFASPLTLTSSDPHVTVSPATWTGPSQPITLTYDGSTAVGSTITATVKTAGTPIGTATTATAFHYLVSTFAGTGAAGNANGANAAATFNEPVGVTVAASGNVFVAERGNYDVREISNGTVTTFSGTGAIGSLDGPAATAMYDYPIALAFDHSGNLFVADHDNNKVREISTAGMVSTFAGTGAAGAMNGPGATATFSAPQGCVFDASGNLYIPDLMNNEIRVITPAGIVSTYAGTETQGSMDGAAASATFNQPSGIAIDSAGDIYVSDTYNNKIRKITPAGIVSTLAGTGASSPVTDGPGASATFNHPQSIVVDSAGDLLVSDQFNNLIRKVTPTGIVSTVAGSGAAGSADGLGTAASFNQPTALAADANGIIYVADFANNKIRAITP